MCVCVCGGRWGVEEENIVLLPISPILTSARLMFPNSLLSDLPKKLETFGSLFPVRTHSGPSSETTVDLNHCVQRTSHSHTEPLCPADQPLAHRTTVYSGPATRTQNHCVQRTSHSHTVPLCPADQPLAHSRQRG